MRIRKEYRKWLESQKNPVVVECYCNTLVLIVDDKNKTVHRDHFNHCPAKVSATDLVAPDPLKGDSNWQANGIEETGENHPNPLYPVSAYVRGIDEGYESSSSKAL